jgi:hypothetical protein
MSLFDPNTILERLKNLPPDQNPFDVLIGLIKDNQKQPWSTGGTVVLVLCAVAWAASFVLNVMVLRIKLRNGERTVIRRQTTVLGTLYMCVLDQSIAISSTAFRGAHRSHYCGQSCKFR